MKKQLQKYKAAHQQRPFVRTPYTRKGFSSTARTRGAAVTGEMKYFDCERSTAPIASVLTTWGGAGVTLIDPQATVNLGDAAVATPACLFAPKPTASLNGRIGRSVKVMKIKISGEVSVGPLTGLAAPSTPQKVRVLLVMDKQTNAAQMTGAQLLNDTVNNIALSSFQNPNNFGRFVVLKDKIFKLENASLSGVVAGSTIVQAGLVHPFKMTVHFKTPITVQFNATNGGTVADIVDHSFHILAGGDGGTYIPQLSYYSRVCYKE